MDSNDTTNTTYLAELYRQTEGNTDAQVSMLVVGSAIGFEEAEARATAENLMILGLVELKTLSGGIGITSQGIKELGITPAPAADSISDANLQLGKEVVLGDSGRQVVETVLAELKNEVAKAQTDYLRLEEIIIDIKTMEVQLLSPNPKVAIIREILRSLNTIVSSSGDNVLTAKLETLLNN